MEETRVLTRAQARMSGAGELAKPGAIGRKEAGASRPRRALGNLTNQQKSQETVGDKAQGPESKKASGVTTRRQSQEAEKAAAAAAAHQGQLLDECSEIVDVTNSIDEEVQPAAEAKQVAASARKKPTAGFSRTLIAKSEGGAHSLARRTQRLQIEGSDTLVVDDDMEMTPSSPMPDIDSKDMGNCLDAAEYAADIFTFFRRVEPTVRIPPDYINQQRYVSRQMRAVLVDWIVDVHFKFKLNAESLFLGIWILDKFLSKQEVERKNLQLAGVAALVIANKYEEVYGPTLRDFESVTAGTYSRSDILKMERIILRTLDFNLTVPTTITFLNRYIKASNYGQFPEFRNLTQYLCEWSLLSNTCLSWAPSQIAAASIYACFKAFQLKLDDNDWPRVMRKHTGYALEDIETCAAYLVNLMDKASNSQYHSLHHKFRKKEFSTVARYKAPVAAFEHINGRRA